MMRKSMIAIACVTALLAGCASQEQAGVANGGSVTNLKKFAAANAAAQAKCDDPDYLFLTPRACVSACHYVGSPAWWTINDQPSGWPTVDNFSGQQIAATPFHLIGDKQACLSECRINAQAVADCRARGYWHPDAEIRRFIALPYVNDAGMSSSTWKKEIQPALDPHYRYQGLIVAYANEGGSVGAVNGPLDRIDDNAQMVIGQLTSRPIIVASMNALGQALGRRDVIQLTAPISVAQSFQNTPMKSLNKNPAGVQWPMTFDGNVTVDQSVN